jgi:signal transduction histidine kinase
MSWRSRSAGRTVPRSGTGSDGVAVVRDDRVTGLATAWCALTLPLLALFALSVPAVHGRKQTPTPAVQAGLDELGVSATAYATWWTGVLLLFGVVCFAVAVLIVARRPADRAAWFAALFLVTLGAANGPMMEALVWHRPGLEGAATLAFQLFLACLVLFLFTFPDGRFSPTWTWGVVAVAVTGLVVARGSLAGPVPEALFWALLLGLAGGVAAQVHRYRRVSTVQQRQQTRWVTLAMAFAVLAQLAFPLLEAVPALSRPGVGAAVLDMASPAGISLAYSLIPLSLAAALLRSQLWGLDVVVNRAVVYATLTVGLLALYVGVAAGLGRSFGAPGDAGGSVFAAAVVALVFAPLRDRVQRAVNRLMYGQRHEPYEVLSVLGQRLEASDAPRGALQTVVETVAAALRSPYVALALPSPERALEVRADTGTPSPAGVVVPLVHRHEQVGELRVAPRAASDSFNSADRALLGDLARAAGAAVQAVRLAEELQHSRERLVTAREEERRRLRRDLHDGLGPALASMTLQAETACELIPEQPDVAARILSDLVGQLQSSTADIRRLVYDLRPPALDDLGLAEALRLFVTRSRSRQLRLDLDLPPVLPPLSAAAEVAVYRIVQEAVVNVLRHAGAASCTVSLRAEDGGVVVEVVDDGVGLDGQQREGVGLRSMRERASELGGSCDVTAGPAGGTQVHVRLPRTSPVELGG